MQISQDSCLKGYYDRITCVMFRAFCIAFLVGTGPYAQSNPAAHRQVGQLVDQDAADWKKVSKDIWDYAELGYHENKSLQVVTNAVEVGWLHDSGQCS